MANMGHKCVVEGCQKRADAYIALPNRLIEKTGKSHGCACFDHATQFKDRNSHWNKKQEVQ